MLKTLLTAIGLAAGVGMVAPSDADAGGFSFRIRIGGHHHRHHASFHYGHHYRHHHYGVRYSYGHRSYCDDYRPYRSHHYTSYRSTPRYSGYSSYRHSDYRHSGYRGYRHAPRYRSYRSYRSGYGYGYCR